MQLFLALQLLFGDKVRLNKQILEAGQVASTAIWQNRDSWPLPANARLYRPAYVRHPVTMWAYESQRNTIFTIDYLFSLDRKRRELYGSAVHGTCTALEALRALGTGTYIDSEEELIKYCLRYNISIPIVVPIEGVNLEAIDKRTKEVTLSNIHERLNLHKIYLSRKHRGFPAPKPKKKPKNEPVEEGEEVKVEPQYEVAPGALTEADLKVLGEQAQLDVKLLQAVRMPKVKMEPQEVEEDVKMNLVAAQEDVKPVLKQKARNKKQRKEAIDEQPNLAKAQLDQKPTVRNTRLAHNISVKAEPQEDMTRRKRASETRLKQQEPLAKRIKVEQEVQISNSAQRKNISKPKAQNVQNTDDKRTSKQPANQLKSRQTKVALKSGGKQEAKKNNGEQTTKQVLEAKKGNGDKSKLAQGSKNGDVENSKQAQGTNGSVKSKQAQASKSANGNNSKQMQLAKEDDRDSSTTQTSKSGSAKSKTQEAKSGNGQKSKLAQMKNANDNKSKAAHGTNGNDSNSKVQETKNGNGGKSKTQETRSGNGQRKSRRGQGTQDANVGDQLAQQVQVKVEVNP